MDVLTPKGLVTLTQEKEMLEIIRTKYNVGILHTPKDQPGKCDGFIYQGDIVKAIFECKCRDMSEKQLHDYGSWIVTYDKIRACKVISEFFCVPFYGFVYLLKTKNIYSWKITNEKGEYLFDFEKRKTNTQKTINGGEAVRLNAFLPVDYAKKLA